MNDSHKSLWFNSIPDFNSSCGHDDRQLEQTLVYQLCSFVVFCLFVVVFLWIFFPRVCLRQWNVLGVSTVCEG